MTQEIYNFKITKLMEIFNNSKQNDTVYLDCKNYIMTSIFPLKNDQYIIFEDKTPRMMEITAFNQQILNRFPKVLKSWFSTSSDIIFYNLISDASNNIIIDSKNETINIKNSISAKYSKYDLLPTKTKNDVNIILNHISLLLF